MLHVSLSYTKYFIFFLPQFNVTLAAGNKTSLFGSTSNGTSRVDSVPHNEPNVTAIATAGKEYVYRLKVRHLSSHRRVECYGEVVAAAAARW